MRVVVLGGGAWGTALAIHAARRHDSVLWLRDGQQARRCADARCNDRYLPGHAFPASLTVEPSLARACAGADLVVLGVPVGGLRTLVGQLQGRLPAGVPIAWVAKGFEADTGLLPGEVMAQCAPGLNGGVFSGPSFAQEVAAGLPVALSAAGPDAQWRASMQEAFHHGHMRVYGSDDVRGVETAGALKNVMAIALGLCDGLEQGLNARAALLTRGLAEMARLGEALGARAATFLGLAGVGDLVLTGTGDLSRNRRVGLALAAGTPLDQALGALGHVAEGVLCCRAAVRRAHQVQVEVPITEAVMAVLDGLLTPAEAMASLLAREARGE